MSPWLFSVIIDGILREVKMRVLKKDLKVIKKWQIMDVVVTFVC